MRRAIVLTLLGTLAGCSRGNESPRPKAVPEPTIDAAIEASAPDASAKAPPVSPFAIIARAPAVFAMRYARDVANVLPLVQRLPGGGLVVAADYARARADGGGALSVELVGRGLETDILYRPAVVQGAEGLRWVWSDAASAIVVAETETSRSGPRLVSYKLGASGFEVLHSSVGYWSAVVRDGSVLALERTAYEVPNSSMYPKGSGFEQNEWRLKAARIAVLSGKAAAPIIPAGVCPTAMSAAPDGTIMVTVERCAATPDPGSGVLRFAPSATQAKVEWFVSRTSRGAEPDDVVPFAASANELYVGAGDRLETWNGKAWTDAMPFRNEIFTSLSRAPNGELWAVVRDVHSDKGEGRLVKRSADGATWSDIALPVAPAEALDDQPYAAPTFQFWHFLKVDALPEEQAIRAQGTRLNARTVDATAEEVLVLASVDGEAFVLSTKPRAPVARLPSVSVQRARVAQSLKRRVAAAPKDCTTSSFLVFPDGTTADAIRAALGAQSGDAGPPSKIAEAIVEGQKRLIVYSDDGAAVAAAKQLAPLAPKRLCGPAVIERTL